MNTRCGECGYAREDYRSASDQQWLRSSIGQRVKLMFEDLGDVEAIPGFGSADSLHAKLTRLAEDDDLHPAVHFTQAAARVSATMAPRPLAGSTGRLIHVNVSRGGVPKLPAGESGVSWRGVVGDKQEERKHHGHAWQALCIWSLEVIHSLQLEGHPIDSGSTGENLTIRGIDWKRARTGVLMEIGDVVCELTSPAVPCAKQARWFADGKFTRISHAHHPGRARWYASVLRPGTVRPGDEVRVVIPVAAV
ncbi:MAG: MOSC domain-containing protein [Acidimicrobiales bacterium]|jgi:MOSC domain-containing protein YiiM